MTGDAVKIDGLLASALRGEDASWPPAWIGSAQRALVEQRIGYHGIAGLIADRSQQLGDWPATVLAPVRDQGIALAMWELRHKAMLGKLLTALAEANIVALLLKGTALAYDLYPVPATRARGDSDILISPADLADTRSILTRLGYRCRPVEEEIADDLALQEVWSVRCDAGTSHHIDLHWQLLNAPALRGVMKWSTCATDPLPLPRLAPTALAMSRVLTLLHTAIHRSMHLTSPYFVDGVTYYGGDRLIWAKDIDLLAGGLSDAQWSQFAELAVEQGVAAVSLDGLRLAERSLGTVIPKFVLDALSAARDEPASAYLLASGQAKRAWKDLLAIRGVTRKLAYLGARAVPTAAFMRAKYPDLSRRPLALLHIRRIIDLIRPRPSQ